MKEDFKISKVEHQTKDFPKNDKWGGKRNSKKPPKKRKAKAVATVERQEIVQHTDSSA